MLGPYPLNSLICGDCVELSKSIPDNSVDMIITDPPYDLESLFLYGWLAREAGRILKDGRYLYVYGGMIAKEILNLLETSPMQLHFVHTLLHSGGYPRWWTKKLMIGGKPIFSLTKGSPFKQAWMATIHESTIDKRFHTWGQGVDFTVKVVDLLTDEGDVIFDPFCGGGTTAWVCQERRRNFLTFDISQEAIETATRRLQGDQVKLFELPRQQQMFSIE